MKETINIECPKGYIIDKEKSTFEKIVFKKKNALPESWEDFCEDYPIGDSEYFIRGDSTINHIHPDNKRLTLADKNLLPTKELAEAFLALMQLMSLRQVWIGNWKVVPDKSQVKHCIFVELDTICICTIHTISRPLSFPTREMAVAFSNCFKDLLEIAKPLI